MRRINACENLNHRRSNVPVRHCPQCGGVVNDLVARIACSDGEHATYLRERAVFCVHCGLHLSVRR